MGAELIAFVAASVVLIVIPGVDFALVTRQAVTYGRLSALTTAAGLLVAGLTHATFAAVGLSALLLASAEAYTAVKLAGAVYLIWLGISFLRSSGRHGRDAEPRAPAPRRTISLRRAFTSRLHDWLTRTPVRRAVDRITGVTLIGVGATVAVGERPARS
jgi:threonine/homoserine/homoserine lactone efflux protein